uniref:Putative secreted protein n=1 Tax=Ixodes ricinus TaxID=34613 RepID=A0A6B0U2B8_IXORI
MCFTFLMFGTMAAGAAPAALYTTQHQHSLVSGSPLGGTSAKYINASKHILHLTTAKSQLRAGPAGGPQR